MGGSEEEISAGLDEDPIDQPRISNFVAALHYPYNGRSQANGVFDKLKACNASVMFAKTNFFISCVAISLLKRYQINPPIIIVENNL